MSKYYTSSHEWVQIDGNIGTVGLTEYARKELGDIVYAELPSLDQAIQAGEAVCVLESTKAAVDVYSPMSGRVIAVNNAEAKVEGWLFQIELTSIDEVHRLLSLTDYEAMLTS